MSDQTPPDSHPQLTAAFNALAKQRPALTKAARPIGVGCFGLVLENEDITISKILFRPETETQLARSRFYFENEVNALRLLTKHPISGLETPILLGPPEHWENDSAYLGQYRMSKISGQTQGWYNETADFERDRERQSAYFKKSGALLARFHESASLLPFATLDPANFEPKDRVRTVPGLRAETNEALRRVDEYLQAHSKKAVVHGDFHGGNIIVNQQGDPVGLLDFAMTGFAENHLCDFRGVPAYALNDFIEGYEEQSGEKIDRHALSATSVSMWADYLNWAMLEQKPEDVTFGITKLNENLNNLIPITHIKP